MLANIKEQSLVLHSIAVGLVAVKMFERKYEKKWPEVISSITGDSETKEYLLNNYKKVLFNAGVYHDIGKLDKNFQDYLLSENAKKNKVEFDVQIEEDNKIDLNSYPLHQELSWAYLNILSNSFKQRNIHYHNDLFLYSVYWHHAKFLRFQNTDFETVDKILCSNEFDLRYFSEQFNIFNENVKSILLNLGNPYDLCIEEGLEASEVTTASISNSSKIPQFQPVFFRKGLDDEICLLKNAINHLTRSILVSSDRIISTLSKEELLSIFENEKIEIDKSIEKIVDLMLGESVYDIKPSVDLMLDKFKAKSQNSPENQKRSELQAQKVKELSEKDTVCILQGPAGVGKTKMMVEWIGKIDNKKRTYLIVPKTNMVNELYKEFSENYLPTIDIEKITGAEKCRTQNGEEVILENENTFKSSICITTIDQVMSLMMGNNKVDVYLDLLNSNLVFDEFHEFMDTPALLMLFIQTVMLKRMSNDGKCLLVSATPNPYLLDKLHIDFRRAIVSIETFNQTSYEIIPNYFIDSDKSSEAMNNDMFNPQRKGAICIFNSASKSQTSSLKALNDGEEGTISFHSKFYSKDRKEIFERLMKEFGKKKKDDENSGCRNAVLRSGPILQASIDLSTDYMLTEISTIDNIYQRLGRVVRWAESDKGRYEIFIPSNIEKKNASITRSLSKNGQYEIVAEFIKFLNEKIFTQESVKLNDLYKAYFEFFENDKVMNAYDLAWDSLKADANKIFEQGLEPIKIHVVNKKDCKVAAKKSLRGGSLFGLACDLLSDGSTPQIVEPDENFDTFSIEKRFVFTEEEETRIIDEMKRQLENNYSSKKYLASIREKYLEKMKKIKGKKKISSIKHYRFLDLARYQETPIMFSYTSEHDLEYEDLKYNTIYKGLKVGILSYQKFICATKH